jgi:hypothetical protein
MKNTALFIIILLFSCSNKSDKNIQIENRLSDVNIIEDEKQIIAEEIKNENIDITGIYIDKSFTNGLKIEILKDGNYKFSQIILFKDGDPIFSELYTAYVIKNNDSIQKYLYYWHTGRYENISGSNSIIVYEIEINGNIIHGKYYFPEELGTPSSSFNLYKK